MSTSHFHRIVVKLGTSSVMRNNKFNSRLVNGLAKDIAFQTRQGKQFILVSSGAIGLGLETMHLAGNGLSIAEQQAMAAIGQNQLMRCYEMVFAKYNQLIAQVLLTQENFENRESLANLKNTLEKLLQLNVVPVINENDAVSVEELAFKKHFSDNDLLAASLAKHINADALIIVSGVGGLFSENPEINGNAKMIQKVSDLDALSAKIVGKSLLGKGGFESKLEAAKIALKNGFPLIVTGPKPCFLEKAMQGKAEGTVFEKRTSFSKSHHLQ